METPNPVVTEPTREPSVVPEGRVRARLAFLRDFPALWADRKTRGKYVIYLNDKVVAVGKTYRAMVRELVARNLPDDDTLIVEVTPASEIEERVFAEEGEL